jgi:hypothetical protein
MVVFTSDKFQYWEVTQAVLCPEIVHLWVLWEQEEEEEAIAGQYGCVHQYKDNIREVPMPFFAWKLYICESSERRRRLAGQYGGREVSHAGFLPGGCLSVSLVRKGGG